MDYNNNSPEDRSPVEVNAADYPDPVISPLTHDYCFSQGRHGGSFYLKLGATGMIK